MAKFLLRRMVYLVILVVIATVFAYLLAATRAQPAGEVRGQEPADLGRVDHADARTAST